MRRAGRDPRAAEGPWLRGTFAANDFFARYIQDECPMLQRVSCRQPGVCMTGVMNLIASQAIGRTVLVHGEVADGVWIGQ